MTFEYRSLLDFENTAKAKLHPGLVRYMEKAAGCGKSLAANLESFDHYSIIPRVLANIDKVSTRTKILGSELQTPILIAPTAFQKLYCENGEKDASDAAREFGTNYVISSFSNCDYSELGRDLFHTWYQLLIYKDKSLMKESIEKAERAGCQAIVLTVDAPIGCTMCKKASNSENTIDFPLHNLPLFPTDPEIPFGTLDDYYLKYIDSSAGWKDIQHIMSFTSLPIILKGILHPLDAMRALELGVRGIIISNHGGRQLDGTISSLEALRIIGPKFRDKMEIYMDGGIRSGSDIFKAIALGARAVFIGRPALYGLAVSGKSGLLDVLHLLNEELRQLMHLTGCSKLGEIDPAHLHGLRNYN